VAIRRLVILLAGALVAAALASCSSGDSTSASDGPLIITQRAKLDTLREELTIRGTLERIEQQTVNLPSGGNFTVVNIEDGDTVSAGDVLYAIGGRPTIAVDGDTPFFRTLDVGSRGPDVLQLERILSVDGLDPGVVDDLFTTQTRAALAKWQVAAGYPASSPEAGEVITLSLSGNPSGYTVGPQNTASVTIDGAREGTLLPSGGSSASGPGSVVVPMAAALRAAYAQTVPNITIQGNAAVVEEGEPAPFVLVSSVAPTADIVVNLGFAGTAMLGSDYNAPPNQQVVFPAGSTSLAVRVNTIEDLTVEPDETIAVTVLAGVGYTGTSTASTTILDDDETELTITSGGAVIEGQTGSFTITASDPPLIDLDVPLNGPGIAVAIAPDESDATAGDDYEALPASVILRAGQASVSVPVVTLIDDVVESDEDVELSIGPGADYSIGGTGTATVVITDATANQTPVITITADADTVTEGAAATFTVDASVATSRDIDLEITFGGTAIDETDVNHPDDLVLPAGATETTITVPSIQDDDIEPDKTITAQVAPGADYTAGAPSLAQVTLESQDVPEIELRANPLTVAEGGTASFVVQASAPAFNEITIDYLVSGRANDSVDYEPIPAFVVLPVGQTSVSVPVQTVTDTVFERDEDVVMRLEPSNGYDLGDRTSATMTITDGDKDKTSGPVLSVTSSAATTAEGQLVTFTVGASAASTRDLDVEVSLGGSAQNTVDYTFPSNDLVLTAGQTQLNIQVQTRQDTIVEPDKTITLDLRDGAGYSLTAPTQASTTIVSDDLPELTLRGGNIALGEGDSAAFIIESDGPVAENTSVNYQVGGSATPGTDFETLTGTVVMLAGQSSVSIPLFTLNDDVVFQPTDMLVGEWPSRVGTVFVKEGQSAPEGTPVIEITEDDFTVSIAVPAADRAELTVGMEVEVEIDASSIDTIGIITELDQNATVDDAGGERYEGRIDIDTTFDAVDGSIATITVVTSEAPNVVVVPIAAVLQGPDGDEVRIIDPDTGDVRRSVVETGLDEGSFIEVKSGIDEGEIVIVEVEG